jgi:hypothetical protein
MEMWFMQERTSFTNMKPEIQSLVPQKEKNVQIQ